MKNLRRILALIVTFSMLLAMGVPAVSEGSEGGQEASSTQQVETSNDNDTGSTDKAEETGTDTEGTGKVDENNDDAAEGTGKVDENNDDAAEGTGKVDENNDAAAEGTGKVDETNAGTEGTGTEAMDKVENNDGTDDQAVVDGAAPVLTMAKPLMMMAPILRTAPSSIDISNEVTITLKATEASYNGAEHTIGFENTQTITVNDSQNDEIKYTYNVNVVANKTYTNANTDGYTYTASDFTVTLTPTGDATAVSATGTPQIVGTENKLVIKPAEVTISLREGFKASSTYGEELPRDFNDALETDVEGVDIPTGYKLKVYKENTDVTATINEQDVGAYTLKLVNENAEIGAEAVRVPADGNYTYKFAGGNYTITRKTVALTSKDSATGEFGMITYGSVALSITYPDDFPSEAKLGDTFKLGIAPTDPETAESIATLGEHTLVLKNGNTAVATPYEPTEDTQKNYSYTVTGNYTITKRQITIRPVANQGSVYGAAIAENLTYIELDGETVVTTPALPEGFKLATVATSASDAGEYSYVMMVGEENKGTSFDSADGNYTFVLDPDVKYNVSKLPVRLSMEGKPVKTYGAEDPSFDGCLTVGFLVEGYAMVMPVVDDGGEPETPKDRVLSELEATISRPLAGEEEDAGTYGYGKFKIETKNNSNYEVTLATEEEVNAETFLFTINPLPVLLSLAGKPDKTFGQADPVFDEYLTVGFKVEGEYTMAMHEAEEGEATETPEQRVLGELNAFAWRPLAGEEEDAGTYGYGKFKIGYDEDNDNYDVSLATAENVSEEDFLFTINPLAVTLQLSADAKANYGGKGAPAKTYGQLDSVLNWNDYRLATFTAEGETVTPKKIIDDLKVTVTRTGAADGAGKIVGNKAEQAGTYTADGFVIGYTENKNYTVKTAVADKDAFAFTINPLEVTLALSGDKTKNIGGAENPSKNYGVSDADAKLDFNQYRTATWATANNVLTLAEILGELNVTVKRPDAGDVAKGEHVGAYGYDAFQIDFTANDNYTAKKAASANDFTFTIKNNVTIGALAWSEGVVTTRKGGTIKAKFTVPAGSPDVTLAVPMTVTAKVDLSGVSTYLTDEGKADLAALEFKGTFTGKEGTVVIPDPDAPLKYAKNGDAWQGGLPAGTKLVITGVQLGDAAGTVNGAAPAVAVSGFEVTKHTVALTMTVAEENKTMYKLAEGSYVVGPEATITLSHDSPLDEWVILSSANGSKTVKVPAGGTAVVKASDMNSGDYEALGVGTCADGLYSAESTALVKITAAMVDDAHLTANTQEGSFVLDNLANTGTKATFENRGDQVQVTLPERPQPGSEVVVTIDGLAGEVRIPAGSFNGGNTATADGLLAMWSGNPENLIHSGAGIHVTYVDAVGNTCNSQGSGSATKSAGRPININMHTVDDSEHIGTAGPGKVLISGTASNYENIIVTINGVSQTVKVSGTGNYDPNKDGDWQCMIDLSKFDLSTGKVTIRVTYEDLTGMNERTFNYKAEVMPVLLTSPAFENYDKLYGFAEYGTTVHVSINGVEYNSKKDKEMFLTGDAGNTVSVYDFFPTDANSFFYWIFQYPGRMKSSDEIKVWYEDFTGSNVSEELTVPVQSVDKFNVTAEVLGANVIDYTSADSVPGTGTMEQHFVVPVRLSELRGGEPMKLPIMAMTGYNVGTVEISVGDDGMLVVDPTFDEDVTVGNGSVKLFGEKPSIQALAGNKPSETAGKTSIDVSGYGDMVWLSARYDVELSLDHVGRLNNFCALAPYDAGSDNRLQLYAKNFANISEKGDFYDKYVGFLDVTDYTADEAEEAAA